MFVGGEPDKARPTPHATLPLLRSQTTPHQKKTRKNISCKVHSTSAYKRFASQLITRAPTRPGERIREGPVTGMYATAPREGAQGERISPQPDQCGCTKMEWANVQIIPSRLRSILQPSVAHCTQLGSPGHTRVKKERPHLTGHV